VKKQDFALALLMVVLLGTGLWPAQLKAQNAPQEPAAAAPLPADAAPNAAEAPAPTPDAAAGAAAQVTAPAPTAAETQPAPAAPGAQPVPDAAPAQAEAPAAAEPQPPVEQAQSPDQGQPAAQSAQGARPADSDMMQESRKVFEEPQPQQGQAESPAPAAEAPPAAAAAPAAEAPPAAAAETAPAPSPEAPKPAQAEIAPAPPPAPVDPKSVTLSIATWGGAYGESQDRAYFQPFTERFGYRIKPVTYDGRYASIKDQAASSAWNLVDLDGEAAARACADKLLEPLDVSMLENAPNGATLTEDFLPAAIRPCAIGSVAWSALVVYDKRLKHKPETTADFFDVKKFPGKRMLPRQPKFTLELALMADGVAPGDVYATLSTPEGQDRAFAKLSSIKDDVLWWEKPAEVFDRLAKHEAAMGLGFNGRAFMAIVGARRPLEMLWDHQIYSFDYWAIPRGAANQDAARAFIRFATSPGPLSDQTRWMPYGPARRSAMQLVGKHAELDLDMKPFLPTSEANMKTALAADDGWWVANGKALDQRFADWVEGRSPSAQRGVITSQ
jgi:putative spermidine/putrescine transport system substrate-binding protein